MSVLDRFRLDGRRALVTGGSRGLGREMALALAEVGADIVITGRDRASLDDAAAAILARGRAAVPIAADMSDPATCERACREALATGPIHVLVNNVGDRRVSIPIEDTPLETWHEMMNLNLTSCFLCTKIIGGAMIAAQLSAPAVFLLIAIPQMCAALAIFTMWRVQAQRAPAATVLASR